MKAGALLVIRSSDMNAFSSAHKGTDLHKVVGGRTSAGVSASCAMIEKTTKSGSPFGIALVGAFATTAGLGEITLKGTGQYFDRLLILRRRFGTIKQRRLNSPGEHAPAHSA